MKRIPFRSFGLVVLGCVLALTLQGTPAIGQVGSWAHNWTKHIKPKTDERYYTKTRSDRRFLTARSTMRPGQLQTGVYGTAGGPDRTYFGESVPFSPKLPAGIPAAQVLYRSFDDESTLKCPGPGRAAVGYLCLYEAWNFQTLYAGTYSPASNGTSDDISPWGFALQFLARGDMANVRGTWAVRAPAAATRKVTQPATGRVKTPFGYAAH